MREDLTGRPGEQGAIEIEEGRSTRRRRRHEQAHYGSRWRGETGAERKPGNETAPENGKSATWGKWRFSTETRRLGKPPSWVLVERSLGGRTASINM
jgi:hypothetical protein